jgi:hypothetical protein
LQRRPDRRCPSIPRRPQETRRESHRLRIVWKG